MDQSQGLSERHTQLHNEGRHLCQDSNLSEASLKDAIPEVYLYASQKINDLGGKCTHESNISLYDCQLAFNKIGGPTPNENNRRVSMKPDGGVIFAIFNNTYYPIFIGEDKVQGTNDNRHNNGLNKQSAGNAIERAGKNIRGQEMLCCHMGIFPSVIFASGCDFHHTETISKRIEMMNYGYPNHYIEMDSSVTNDILDNKVNIILNNISITKPLNIYSKASVFVKAHKYDVMPHNSSLWRKKDIILICKKVIDLSIEYLINNIIHS